MCFTPKTIIIGFHTYIHTRFALTVTDRLGINAFPSLPVLMNVELYYRNWCSQQLEMLLVFYLKITGINNI